MGDEAKRQVLEATDIVALIGEHMALRPRGREFVALCPFHDDHKPSMNVVPAKQIYKCFSCGAGGDAFSFVMDYHKMTFPEALAHLAERARIALPRSRFSVGGRGACTVIGGGEGAGEGGESGPSPRQVILKANQQAADFYRGVLRDERDGAIARRYLSDRGINEEMIEAFRIGCAPDKWDALARCAAAKGAGRDGFEQAGLIAPRKHGGGHYDRLRHRLIFPILDNLNRPIAFGGRILPGGSGEHASDAKYLNSPEHAAFHKSSVLFGMHRAQKPIIDSRTAVIVEGYTDVIACHQAGLCNVVATLGTALTADHARALRRYCDQVVLIFDADEAGQKAADRALGVFFHEPLDISIAVLPEGLDPADLLAKDDGPDRWRAALDGAVDAMAFQFARVRRAFEQSGTMAGRQRITEEYLRTLVQLGLRQLDRRRHGLVFARLADLLGMTPGGVQDALRQVDAGRTSARASEEEGSAAPPEKLTTVQRAERHYIGCLLNDSELFHTDLPDGRPISETIVPDEFIREDHRRLYHAISEWLHDHDELTPADLRDAVDQEPLRRLALDAQMEVHRLTGGEEHQLSELFIRSASAVDRHRAEQDYRQRKMEMHTAAPPEEDPAAPVDGPADETKRLDLAIAHFSAHPSARRMPRPVG